LNFAFNTSNIVKVINAPISLLFNLIDIHLSIYSTTLFDALRYNKKNYALYIKQYGDYVDSIVKEEIAEKIDIFTNPFLLDNKLEKSTDSSYFFETFNNEILKTV
jgi:hypothetical protein